MKSRGPNPNPTAQAQSKRCLPLSTKTQNIIDNIYIFESIVGVFLEPFPQKWPEGSRATPLKSHKTPTWIPTVPKWSPRVPQSTQKTHNYTSRVSKWKPKVPQWNPKGTQRAKETPQGFAKCHKGTHRCQQQAQLDTNALGKAPGCTKTCTNRPRPGARRRRRRSGRGLEGRAHQAASRSPHRGSEVQVHKSVVLEVK